MHVNYSQLSIIRTTLFRDRYDPCYSQEAGQSSQGTFEPITPVLQKYISYLILEHQQNSDYNRTIGIQMYGQRGIVLFPLYNSTAIHVRILFKYVILSRICQSQTHI